ncbi:MAG: hypothetical protein AAF066_02140 [Pseudomonadota bacterium]
MFFETDEPQPRAKNEDLKRALSIGTRIGQSIERLQSSHHTALSLTEPFGIGAIQWQPTDHGVKERPLSPAPLAPRLAYQSAVRLAEGDNRFDHRGLFYRLFGTRVRGQSDVASTYDAGATAAAAAHFETLLFNKAISPPPYRSRAAIRDMNSIAAVDAYSDRWHDTQDTLSASLTALRRLPALPPYTFPIAWVGAQSSDASEELNDILSLLPQLARFASALEQAADTADAICQGLETAQTATVRHRKGSIGPRLAAMAVIWPCVTEQMACDVLRVSKVTFQSGVKALVKEGFVIEVTGRNSHRAWITSNGPLSTPFENFPLAVEKNERKKRSKSRKLNSPTLQSAVNGLDQAIEHITKLV